MMRDKLICATLIEARTLLARGWCQGANARYYDTRLGFVKCSAYISPPPNQYCARGAIARATKTVVLNTAPDLRCERWTLRHLVHDRIAKVIQSRVIESWNDNPDRSKTEVLAAFDMAIENASKSLAEQTA